MAHRSRGWESAGHPTRAQVRPAAAVGPPVAWPVPSPQVKVVIGTPLAGVTPVVDGGRRHGDRAGPRGRATPRLAAVAQDRDQLVGDVRRYIETIENLVAGLQAYRDVNEESLVDLLGGMDLKDSFRLRDTATLSRELSRLLDEFETSRQAVRRSCASTLHDEGMTLRQIGLAFGVSHQLASRFTRTPVDKGRPPSARQPHGNTASG